MAEDGREMKKNGESIASRSAKQRESLAEKKASIWQTKIFLMTQFSRVSCFRS
jgi:hypothetical protein